MKKRYKELKKKIICYGIDSLTDFEQNELVFLEEDLKEAAEQKRLVSILADRSFFALTW